MLDPGKPSFTPKKKEPNAVMFVSLQGILFKYFTLFVNSTTTSFTLIYRVICLYH